MFDNIRADISRKRDLYFARKGFLNRTVYIYFTPGSLAVMVYRFGRWIYTLKIPVLKQLLYLLYFPLKAFIVICFGIHIPVRAEVGRGFVIHNFSCIFIPRSKIGKNLTVQQGVTLGAAYGKTGQPVVEDNVFIGAGGKVMGGIRIGNNVVIGANSLVINDVPDNAVVVGVPARIIANNRRAETDSQTIEAGQSKIQS
jgi:serine acetyltransferase